MNTAGRAVFSEEVYSADDIAQAAGVPVADVERGLRLGRVLSVHGYVTQADAVRLVRALVAGEPLRPGDGAPLTLFTERKRRGTLGLVASGVLHTGFTLLLLLATSLGLLNASATEQFVQDPTPVRLVFLTTPGPGGGGGGGGLKIPLPARRAERKTVIKKKLSSPVPEVRRQVPPPQPAPPAPPPQPIEPKVVPPKIEPPPIAPPPPAVQAPVAPAPADATDTIGVPTSAPTPPSASQGAGTGGGAGTGSGTGLGEGRGSGIGPGSGGGTGGGPYRSGAGIEPPTLQREVKASYTDEARRRGIEGEVLLEIVVRRDGSVGDVRIMRSLGSGLDQRAIDAVRQWRFGPARRHGAAVDVIVEVAVQFKLR